MDPIYTYHTAPNGLRMVHRRCDSPVGYCGVAVNVGSRDEEPGRFGLAHFVEHTIFKGTARRRAFHIINRMETVGGELNAYTTKEETMIYSLFPAGNLVRAVDLIADLVLHSEFPRVQIDREREVVADEIDSYLDTPSEAVFDDFEDLIFAGSGLGHNILGTVEDIASFTPEVCRDYLDRFYSPGEMVFFYMGPDKPERVIACAEKYFGAMNHPSAQRRRDDAVQATAPFDIVRQSGNHQAHTVAGARVGGLHDPRRYATALLTNILGGPGMNSLLNVELREKRGLVYSIEASTSLFTDTGLFTLYMGCDHDDVARCRRIAANVIDSMASSPMSPRRLEAAKKQYLGQLIVASENREQAALSAGRATLLYGRVRRPDEVTESVNSVTAADIMEAAAMIASGKCSFLTLG